MSSFLFHINGYKVEPTPEVLLVEPFKSIWERDKSKDKRKALKDFAYIEFMASKLRTNPFAQYPENVRREEILNKVIKDKKYKPDKLVEEGMQFIKDMQSKGSAAYRLYKTSLDALFRLEQFLNRIDFNERDKSGKPIWKPADILKYIKETKEAMSNLRELEDKLYEDMREIYRVYGGKTISYFADPENL